MSLVQEKLQWLHQQMADGTFLRAYLDEETPVEIYTVELYPAYEGKGIFSDRLIINNTFNITDVEIHGFNPKYTQATHQYPTYPDRRKYIEETSIGEDVERRAYNG